MSARLLFVIRESPCVAEDGDQRDVGVVELTREPTRSANGIIGEVFVHRAAEIGSAAEGTKVIGKRAAPQMQILARLHHIFHNVQRNCACGEPVPGV